MNFKIGDRVKFLNDVGGGIVTGFIENSMVKVETEDGFEMPVPAGELMHDSGLGMSGDGRLEEKSPQKKEPEKPQQTINVETYKHVQFKGEICMALVPDNFKLLHVSNFSLYLVNNTSYDIHYSIASFDGPTATLVKRGTLKKGLKLNVSKYSQTDLSKIERFQIQGIFCKEGLYDPVPMVDETYSIADVSFYKGNHFTKSKYFKEPVLVLGHTQSDFAEAVKKLSESEIAKVTIEKEGVKSNKPAPKPKQKPGIEEIDLHIEAIIDDHKDMSNGEILNIQMDRFE
ncbi:MAG: DUF2027 domain-containing protein, partial [Bacteroidales bacterium]|nr:DUF2027 domain-containing protein [Bacteroidales bacterium]